MQRLSKLPRPLKLPTFREGRQIILDCDRLDDVAPVRYLALEGISSGLDAEVERLLNQAVAFIRQRRPDIPFPVLASLYEYPTWALGAKNRWQSVHSLTNAAIARGIFTRKIIAGRMRALFEQQRYADVTAAWALFAEHDIEPTASDYDEAIGAFLRNVELSKAQALLAEKASKGFPTTARTSITLLGGMSLYGGNRVMEERLLTSASGEDLDNGTAIKQDVRVLNTLLSVRLGRRALRDALAVLDEYDFSAFPASLLDDLRGLSHPPVLASTDPSFHSRPRPDSATIVSLVGMALREQRVDLAQRVLVESQRAGIPFNDHVAAAVLRTLLARNDPAAAEMFVDNLAEGTARLGNITLPKMAPSVMSYEVLLAGMLRHRGLSGANACFRRRLERDGKGTRVSEGMTRALVQHLALEADSEVRVSARVLNQVRRFTEGRTRATPQHLSILMRAAWTREREFQHHFGGPEPLPEAEFPMPALDELPNERSKLRHSPPAPNAATYVPPEAALLVSPSGRHSDQSPVSSLRQSLSDRNAQHDRETSRHVLRNDYLIRYIAAKWEYLQSQVIDLGVRPTYHHICVLMRAYFRMGDAKGASLALHYALEELHLDPHPAYYSTLISGHARLGEFDAASRAYKEFQATGLEPDRNLYAALAMRFARQRDPRGVERVFDFMREQLRSRAPHPQLRAQSVRQQTAAGASASGSASPSADGLPAATLPYDPTLDPVFVSILYRALTSSNQYMAAQERVSDSLERGLVPDSILLRVLERTHTWIRWKESSATRPGGSGRTVRTATTGAKAGGVEVEGSLDVEQLAEIKQLNALNISRVRKALQRTKPKVEKKELRELLGYWEKAEQDAREEIRREKMGI
ncbi:hypothetical protein Rhopal_002792-T1 [Rhodotorula paludigena]|uniref:Uncharacterized protein n=1 Tax=Rhodotorula paludigena TaxID=86838 RepID=A0AAV5GI33_9BASI|nr:hypothetical protein Rhopal_002792-T1 [Rhodotorula paludigena]